MYITSNLELFKPPKQRLHTAVSNDVTTAYFKLMEIKENTILLLDKTIMIPTVEKETWSSYSLERIYCYEYNIQAQD